MDEQAVNSGKQDAGCVLRGCAVSLAVLLVLAAVILLPALSRAQLGPLILGEGSRERDNIIAIARSFDAFRTEFGRYPESDDEWRSFEASADSLLDAGPTSVEPQYRIRWGALGDPETVVIMSADRDLSKRDIIMFPRHRRWGQEDADLEGVCRFVMLGDGTVTYGPNADWEQKRDFAEWAGWSFAEERPKD